MENEDKTPEELLKVVLEKPRPPKLANQAHSLTGFYRDPYSGAYIKTSPSQQHVIDAKLLKVEELHKEMSDMKSEIAAQLAELKAAKKTKKEA